MAAVAPASHQLTPREQLTVARILKVNHAGEHGAIRIYRAQIAFASWLCPDMVQPLSEMLAHEIEHQAAFFAAMPMRHARPCRAMWLWGFGGGLLGSMTALLGRQAIWTTTASVESAVHRHLDDQLRFLEDRDPELWKVIAAIREEELSHLRVAQSQIDGDTRSRQVLAMVISLATDALIWLSTQGDSARMARDLAASTSTPRHRGG